MSISSISSPRSALSPKTNGYATSDYFQQSPSPASALQAANYQASLASSRPPTDGLNLSPDELFTKHTVSEVKAVQQRLRADADAKQEELRLMVGERYRDLLQASSSIIAIASSSRRVVEALQECRTEITSQRAHELPAPPKTAALEGIDDLHLYTLQVLSAHMKLLLDAPEHLWRLIERQKYLQAAWLFLLARVVHRALVQGNESDEHSWFSEGIDILNEFPLVQRQWEVVSQFRTQIIHKSTLSLREASASYETTCAILVTLHLLDSRPLSETLNTLFLQRTKALQALLSWTPDSPPTSSGTRQRPASVREVIKIMKNSLRTIFQTVGTARHIFCARQSSPSLIGRVLGSIQADNEGDRDHDALPDDLIISSQSLLTQLTSSANFQLLPPNLRYYKPYIDMDSSSTSLPQDLLTRKLQDWFASASGQWRQSAERWISGLLTIKDVGSLRNSLRRNILAAGLEESEKEMTIRDLISLCNKRVIEIWKTRLSDAERDSKARLRDLVFADNNEDPSGDSPPVEYLFQPPPIPNLPQSIKSFVDTPFQRYQASLKRQLVSRSARLDSVISTLEQCARNIQMDFAHLKATGDGETGSILEELTDFYRPTAISVTKNIVSFVDGTSSDAISQPKPRLEGLAILSRVTCDLVQSSSFIDNIGCDQDTVQEFKRSMMTINHKVLEKWRAIMMAAVAREHQPFTEKRPMQAPVAPSPQLLRALLKICENIQHLGLFHYPTKQHAVAKEALRSIVELWLKDDLGHEEQIFFDRSFLKKLADLYGESFSDVSNLLADKLKSSVSTFINLVP
ncbi:hypothetical protein CPC08DRAFT_65181 [Agrocybe pediades]|nr:hypothetical protein CPC08DRAFT_65181 [Agrocybe pediades]